MKGYYESLLAVDGGSGDSNDCDSPTIECGDGKPKASRTLSCEKWRGQIEKVDRRYRFSLVGFNTFLC